MARFLVGPLLAALLAILPVAARAQTEQQTLVDRATLSLQEMVGSDGETDSSIRSLLKRAKAVMVCPRVFKASFFVGGEGGGCVLVGRSGAGWTSPAFYGMGTGSFGLQFGIADSQVLLIVLTHKGLQALMDSQFKIGADASVAVATLGGGVSGSTTAALQADIVSFASSRGLFAGVSLQGSLLSVRSDWNTAYYGRPLGAHQIVMTAEGDNPGAAPLKEMLAKFAGG